MRIPDGLAWLQGSPEGVAWLDSLPRRVDALARTWDLDVGAPFEGSNVSWVAPAERDGEDVVLKVQWPHPECEHEADALALWDGNGAVNLLAHDRGMGGLLLERCVPGTHLSGADVDAVEVMVDLLPRLWTEPAGPFRTLEMEAAAWAESLVPAWEGAGRPCERRLVDAARSLLVQLGPTQGEQVLVHQDLHGDNVLAAQRSPWLVIDPKPLVGEREFSCAPIIRAFEFGHGVEHVRGRLDGLSASLGLDRERCRGWAVAQTMAWSFSSTYMFQHHDTARWLLDL